MKPFDYIRAGSLDEAVAAGAEPGTAFLAGGTNLLDLMKAGVQLPDRLVDISRLPGLDLVETLEDGSVRIGALVRNSDLARDDGFARRFPAVAEALLSGASGQLRNAATMGGNVLQQTRCRYFYNPNSRCNRRASGSGCDALDGLNGGHAVLGWTPQCIATHPSDLCVALAALDADVEIAGPGGTKTIALEELYSLPDEESPGGSVLVPGDIIVAVVLPAGAADFAQHARYLKVRDRTSYAFALISGAAMLDIEKGRILSARLALGGVAAKPWRCRDAESVLQGRAPDEEAFSEAADLALADATPSGENAYKIKLARRLVKRALKTAADGTPSQMPALPGSVFSGPTGE